MAENSGELSTLPNESANKLTPMGISRRQFLRAALGVAGATVLSQFAGSDQTPANQVTQTEPQIPEIQLNEQTTSEEFFVIQPGLGGSAEDLTYLRKLMDEKYGEVNNFVFSSIAEPGAYANKESLAGYYKKQAEKVAKVAGDKKTTIVGHSLGGLEMLELSKELLKTGWSGKNLELVFFVTPGLGLTNLASSLDLGIRLYQLSHRLGELDQHIIAPVGEGFYQDKTIEVPSGYELVEDTEKERDLRRAEFRKLATAHPEMISDKNPEEVLRRINNIGEQILQIKDEAKIEGLLEERGLLLRPTLDYLAAGKNIPASEHLKYLQRYGEDSKALSRNLPWVYANLLSSIGKIALNQAQGIDETLAEIVRSSERKDVKVLVDLARAQNDLALTSQDVEIFQGRLGQRQLGDLIKTILFMQNEGHTTFGYTPVVPNKILDKI